MSPPLQKFEAARKGLSCSQLLFSYCPSVSLDFSSPLVWLYGGIIHPNLTVVGCVCYVDFFFVSFLAITLNDAWLSATYLSFHLFLMTAAEALWRCLTCLQTIVSLWVAEGDPKKGLNPKKEFKNVCVWCGSRTAKSPSLSSCLSSHLAWRYRLWLSVSGSRRIFRKPLLTDISSRRFEAPLCCIQMS